MIHITKFKPFYTIFIGFTCGLVNMHSSAIYSGHRGFPFSLTDETRGSICGSDPFPWLNAWSVVVIYIPFETWRSQLPEPLSEVTVIDASKAASALVCLKEASQYSHLSIFRQVFYHCLLFQANFSMSVRPPVEE